MALTAVLLAGNAAAQTGAEGLVMIKYTAIAKPYMLILLIVLTLIEAVALLSFKVRILQMRLAVVAGLIAFGLQAWLGVMYFTSPGYVFRWTVIFPLLIAICDFLAARGAFQDQLVVESAQRLRSRRKR
ncbi:MAG: DUF4293 family protein [Bacteroidales bacterium]|nr:DUF4293 family protein [Bacteroidales bacterium]